MSKPLVCPQRANSVTPLRIGDAVRLLRASEKEPRTRLLFSMSFFMGLGARELHGLDVADVFVLAGGGPIVRDKLAFRTLDGLGREMSLGPVRVVLGEYGRMRFERQGLSAWDAASPLFVGRTGERLSAWQMRKDFGRYREQLGLRPSIAFSSLRTAFHRGPEPELEDQLSGAAA